MSFLNIFINIPIGVTTKKNIIPIIIGEIILPNKIPNLNQILFKGVNNFDCSKPEIIKKNDNKKKMIIKYKELSLKYK